MDQYKVQGRVEIKQEDYTLLLNIGRKERPGDYPTSAVFVADVGYSLLVFLFPQCFIIG